MMKMYPALKGIAIVIFLVLPLFSSSQQELQADGSTILLSPLTAEEMQMLRSLPELKLPAGYGNRELPYMVDNSTYPWMRPVYNQDGLSCGQASGIGYNFTYEMDRARNLPANVIQNQYPTHFAWNFMNGGYGWYGSSYLHSFQMLKEVGMMNVADYGGAMGYGGPSRWISGYAAYYNGMHNRINRVYQICVGDPDGLLTFKHWLHSHLDESATGGVGSFYAQYMSATTTLPPGTPEGGKYVLTAFGGSANHAMTIVGYNDSIRWDYNNDGQYTNNIDINGDGTVNMKDWEIGGFKMVQSYGGAPNWGDQGYAYMMYKTVADNLGQGGIWNHCVHVLDVKPVFDPQLTARVILTHDSRDKIKVLAGISNNPAQDHPDIVLGFPIFDYQAAGLYMQGGTTEADKTIELGLDLSPLLSYINLGQPVRIFLMVAEKDPAFLGTGQVNHVSIYDHTAGGIEITSSQSNVPIAQNDTTTLWVNHTFSFDRIHIVDEMLPAAPEGEMYTHQMTAAGGTAPYAWSFDRTYSETNGNNPFPAVNATQLNISNSSSGFVMQSLGFDFPFYDSSYSNVAVHVDGYLMFDDQLFPYPYFTDDKNLFDVTRNISPFMNHRLLINTTNGEGVWFEGDSTMATFRWKVSIENYPNYQMNFAVRLHPDGKIEYFYGSMTGCDHSQWIAGISDGDTDSHQVTERSNRPTVPANSKTTLVRYNYPPELEISESGLITGIPLNSYAGLNLGFKVTDNSFISATKTLILSSSGIVVVDSVSAGGNEVIGFNETVLESMKLTNIEADTVQNAVMTIHINDPYITVTDSTGTIGTLLPGITYTFENLFTYQVSSEVPDGHVFTMSTVIDDGGQTWTSDIIHTAYAPVVGIVNAFVMDDNNRLDPGDTADVVVSYTNNGGVEVTSLNTLLSSTSPWIDILDNFCNIPLLQPGDVQNAAYTVAVDDETLPGQLIPFHVSMTGDNNYMTSGDFELSVGLFGDDFETGDLQLLDWGFDGNRDWFVESGHPYEGIFSAKSGSISHNQESILMIDAIIQAEGQVSFYKKVWCEDDPSEANNYDFLAFSIDGQEQARWDGNNDWSFATFSITQGFHRFEWKYRKDATYNAGYDAAWIDKVSFTAPIIAPPVLVFSDESPDTLIRPDETVTDTLVISNTGQGADEFNIYLCNTDPSAGDQPAGRCMEGSWLSCSEEFFRPGNSYTLSLSTYNASLDSEWIEHIYLEFPEGIEVTGATPFIGSNYGDLSFLEGLGNGATAHWFGENENGWGIIHGGESANATVTIYVLNNFLTDAELYYEVHGDIYGQLPHIITGTISLRNLGPTVSWLAVDVAAGYIPGLGSKDIGMTYDPVGMEDGTYNAYMLITDNFQWETVIPVTMTIDQFLGAEPETAGHGTLQASPNPFLSTSRIMLNLEKADKILLYITDLEGKPICWLAKGAALAAGSHTFPWDGKDESGQSIPAGVYLLKAEGQFVTAATKIIKSGN